jgi:hypothetical protein
VLDSVGPLVVGALVRLVEDGNISNTNEWMQGTITQISGLNVTVNFTSVGNGGDVDDGEFFLVNNSFAGLSAAPNSGGGGGGGAGAADNEAGAGGGGVGINGLGSTGTGGPLGLGGTGGSGGGTGFAVLNGNRSGGSFGGGAGAGADRVVSSGANICNGAGGAVVIAYGVQNFYPSALI